MSLDIKKNHSLKAHNTFAIESVADTFVTINSEEDFVEATSQFGDAPFVVLGGGSNLLFDQDRIHHPVFWINTKGIQKLQEDDNTVVVRAMAGENWHDFVLWCLQQGYGGLENLSLIPGSVGAAPVQNIGAYGVEVRDMIDQVEVFDLHDKTVRNFSANDCEFAYRDSIFKRSQHRRWIILSVSFRLTRHKHQLKLDYGAIQQTLQEAGLENPAIQDVSNAVIKIRQEKLPDPKVIPNAGSFFKNPIIGAETFRQLKEKYPDIPYFELPDNRVKIPAGWLIDQCGWKGKNQGDSAVHENHALVLVNHGHANGDEILALANSIKESVMHRFELSLAFEVNLGSEAVFSKD